MVAFRVERHLGTIEILNELGVSERGESEGSQQKQDGDFGEIAGRQRAPREG